MADHQQEEVQGASPGEQLIEACRRNNTSLLQSLISSAGSPEKAADLLNNTTTVLGNHAYHEAALRGNYEVIDILLDQENFECDPLTRIDHDTPLHSAIRYLNSLPLPLSEHNTEFAAGFIGMMLEAGSDARIKNKANLTPAQLADPKLGEVRRQLEDAVLVEMERGDFVEEEGDLVDGRNDDVVSDSGSDFDRDERSGK